MGNSTERRFGWRRRRSTCRRYGCCRAASAGSRTTRSIADLSQAGPLHAIVIGSGPNGLAAAIALARAGHSVRIYEAEDTIGGGMRSAPLTGPGSVHDLCSTVHALVPTSPFLRTLPLAEHGLSLVTP